MREQTNALMFGGLLSTCLAVEYVLGRSDALKIHPLDINSIGSLYNLGAITLMATLYDMMWLQPTIGL